MYVMGISEKVKSINIEVTKNICLHFFAYLTSDPDLNAVINKEPAYVDVKIKDAPNVKSLAQSYLRQQDEYNLTLQNPNTDPGKKQYLKILCPFTRAFKSEFPLLTISFTQKSQSELNTPEVQDTSTEPVNGRKVPFVVICSQPVPRFRSVQSS